jgi:hypothetical protein
VLSEHAVSGSRIAIFGRGEAAELAYSVAQGVRLEPIAIFDQEGGHDFLGMPVRPIAEHDQVSYDLMIVATLESSGQQWSSLIRDGVPRDKLFTLRQMPTNGRKTAIAAPVGMAGERR